MANKNDITVICDNGGGITLQIVNAIGQDWQHYYHDPVQCAQDIRAAVKGANPIIDWDGNDLDDDQELLDPSDDDVRNGGYRVTDVTRLSDLASFIDSGWHNEAAIGAALWPDAVRSE